MPLTLQTSSEDGLDLIITPNQESIVPPTYFIDSVLHIMVRNLVTARRNHHPSRRGSITIHPGNPVSAIGALVNLAMRRPSHVRITRTHPSAMGTLEHQVQVVTR